MKQVGIIGLDTSHCYRFTELLNVESAPPEKRVNRAQVTAVWDENRENVGKFLKTFPTVKAVEKPEDMLTTVDAVMVLLKDADIHLRYAKSYLEAGLPTFIDKPLANRLGDAFKILSLAESHETPLMSCSALRYALELADLKSRLEKLGALRAGACIGPGDLFYYGIHAAEMLHTVFGPGIEWVCAVGDESKDVALVRYGDGKTVTLSVLRDSVRVFHTVAYCEKGWGQAVVTDVAFYREMLKRFVEMVKTRKPPIPYDWTLEVIKTLVAVRESVRTGRRVYLKDLKP